MSRWTRTNRERGAREEQRAAMPGKVEMDEDKQESMAAATIGAT